MTPQAEAAATAVVVTAMEEDQKDEEEPLMTNSASSPRKADEQPDTGVLVDTNPAHAEMGWGWLAVVGLVCALGIGLTYIQRIKRMS